VITALHFKRNRPYLHALIFMLLVSWISLVISATCTMPMPSALTAMPEHMPGCSESGVLKHTSKTMQDCTLKPCLDSRTHPFPDFNRLAQPDLPVLVLGLIWTFFTLSIIYLPIRIPRKTDPPPTGRRILLIYRFCTLLN
jgi:hypothetical protein